MPEILDAERGQASSLERALKPVEHDIGRHGSSVDLGEDEVLVVVERAELASTGRLAGAVLLELLDDAGVERNGARAAMCLGWREDQPLALDALQRLADPSPSRFKVEVAPAQGHEFAGAHAGGHGQADRQFEVSATDRGQRGSNDVQARDVCGLGP